MCVSVVYRLVDNDTRRHSGQRRHTISTSKKMFFSDRELKKALRDTLTGAAWYVWVIDQV